MKTHELIGLVERLNKEKNYQNCSDCCAAVRYLQNVAFDPFYDKENPNPLEWEARVMLSEAVRDLKWWLHELQGMDELEAKKNAFNANRSYGIYKYYTRFRRPRKAE